MIAFDNGPAHGDYVRYIDDLMERGAIASTAGVLPSNDLSGTLAQTRERLTRPPANDSAAEWARQNGAQNTGFAAPTAPTASATAAAAIASALASGQMSGSSLPIHTKVGLAAIALGIVLIVVGFFWTPLNILVVAGGGALIAWAIRMMRDATARGSSTRR